MIGTAFDVARRKSRHGSRDWLVWRERAGELRSEPVAAETIKRAMLASGTAGHFTVISGGRASRIGWRLALIMLRNARAGYV